MSLLKNNSEDIFSKYETKETIGRGTFGKVKLGININSKEKVAIKILEKRKIKNKDDSERVEREIEILKNTNNINIIKTNEIIETKENYYLIMEYCEKGELFNYIVRKQRLNDKESSYFYYQLIKGLEYIHSKKIVHRDLKPENLLLDKNNILKIIDFGLSNYFNNENNLLKTPCGSPCYASPEMVSGKKYNGFYIDIWSSGIILYAMICGFLPFEDKNNNVLFKKIANCKIDYPKFISKNAKSLLKKIIVNDPVKRIKIKDIQKEPFYLQGKEIFKEKHPDLFNEDDISEFDNNNNKDIQFIDNNIINDNIEVYKEKDLNKIDNVNNYVDNIKDVNLNDENNKNIINNVTEKEINNLQIYKTMKDENDISEKKDNNNKIEKKEGNKINNKDLNIEINNRNNEYLLKNKYKSNITQSTKDSIDTLNNKNNNIKINLYKEKIKPLSNLNTNNYLNNYQLKIQELKDSINNIDEENNNFLLRSYDNNLSKFKKNQRANTINSTSLKLYNDKKNNNNNNNKLNYKTENLKISLEDDFINKDHDTYKAFTTNYNYATIITNANSYKSSRIKTNNYFNNNNKIDFNYMKSYRPNLDYTTILNKFSSNNNNQPVSFLNKNTTTEHNIYKTDNDITKYLRNSAKNYNLNNNRNEYRFNNFSLSNNSIDNYNKNTNSLSLYNKRKNDINQISNKNSNNFLTNSTRFSSSLNGKNYNININLNVKNNNFDFLNKKNNTGNNNLYLKNNYRNSNYLNTDNNDKFSSQFNNKYNELLKNITNFKTKNMNLFLNNPQTSNHKFNQGNLIINSKYF